MLGYKFESLMIQIHTVHDIMCMIKGDEIGSSRAFVQTIRNDSSDIVSVIRQAYEVVVWSSNWHMYTDHDFCDYFKQNAKRYIVVENISGLTIAIAPVLNCNL